MIQVSKEANWQLRHFHLISPRMTSIWDLANPQLRDIAVYEPGKPIEETAREVGTEPDAIIKLASNENPLGPSLKAARAMRAALENAHLYPDGSGFYLCKAIAAKLGLATENIILGNGSNEVIEFLGHAFLNPGDDVVTFQYAFIIYKLLATALHKQKLLPSGYRCALLSAARIASIAFGEGPSGFSFEASLMIASGSMPSSRAVSSVGFPGS